MLIEGEECLPREKEFAEGRSSFRLKGKQKDYYGDKPWRETAGNTLACWTFLLTQAAWGTNNERTRGQVHLVLSIAAHVASRCKSPSSPSSLRKTFRTVTDRVM